MEETEIHQDGGACPDQHRANDEFTGFIHFVTPFFSLSGAEASRLWDVRVRSKAAMG